MRMFETQRKPFMLSVHFRRIALAQGLLAADAEKSPAAEHAAPTPRPEREDAAGKAAPRPQPHPHPESCETS